MKIAVAGTGYVGLSLSVLLSQHHSVWAVDIMPEKVELEVIETEPAVKGNTATNATKDAKLETGLIVRVPLFIEQGEKIVVYTTDGKYASRA